MSLLTIILIAALAAITSWLLIGLAAPRRAARRVPGNIDRTATRLFETWSDH